MGGIAGVIQIGGEPRAVVAPQVLDRMVDVVAHRGPDGRATFAADGVALGARLLREDPVEAQERLSRGFDGVHCVSDAELYGDTDTVPSLYGQHGPAFPEQLRGKFAIALWDAARRQAVLVRDRLGTKPLYFARVGDLLVFGSELKSVLASGLIPQDLDYEAIDAYLALGYVPTPRTPFRAVSKLFPGCRLVVDGAGERVERYWEYPKPNVASRPLDEREYADRLLSALEDSVRSHLTRADQVAAVVSGGLDSSLVVGLLARNTTKPVKTFTVGFKEAGEQNELDDARFVSEAFGTEHHELELSFTESPLDFADLIWHLDEPLADLSALGLFGLARLASEHVSGVFSGQGADQLMGGYQKHAAASIAGYYKRIPGAAVTARAVASVTPRRTSKLKRAALALGASDPAARLLAMSGRIDPELRRRLARGQLAALDGLSGERAARSRLNGMPDDPLAAELYLDAQMELVDDMLHYFDRASMAHGLETRVPFLDHHVVECCATIPSHLKVKRLTSKYVLRLAASDILPSRVLTSKKKVGFFHSAVEGWFRGQIDIAVSDYLLADAPRSADFLDTDELRRMVLRYQAGDANVDGYSLFTILMLEAWLASYVPRALAAAQT